MSAIARTIHLPQAHSFFLFGARGVGKTSLLHDRLRTTNSVFLDLLNARDFEQFGLQPSRLSELVASLPTTGVQWVVIDEVQKAPELLNMVHLEIEAHSRAKMSIGSERPKQRELYFALTGSSARKLKRGRANLLAGRAFLNYLYPLVHSELPESITLSSVLRWGTLPAVVTARTDDERRDLLMTYAHTYLREEILEEQIARSGPTFRRFLEIAAQMNGEPINFASIARDTGLSPPTVQSYFEILEDTLIATRLEPYHESVRKRQRVAPKYYFFDLGVVRALAGGVREELTPHNYGFGKAFEHFLMVEIFRLASYAKKDWRFSYLRTKDDLEIDLIIDRPGMPKAVIEIKSTENVRDDHLRSLRSLGTDISKSQLYCLCLEQRARRIDKIEILPWKLGLYELGL